METAILSDTTARAAEHEAAEREVELHVDASMGVTVPHAAVTVVLGGSSSADLKQHTGTSDSTPVKPLKTPRRLTQKTKKIAAIGLLVLAVVGVAGGVIGRYYSSSPSNITSTQSFPTPNTSATNQGPTTRVSTIAGYGSAHPFTFSGLSGVAVALNGSVYVSAKNQILRLMDGGDVSAYSGSTDIGYVDGDRGSARYNGPRSMALSSRGDLYICDVDNQLIRKVTGGSTVNSFWSKTLSDLRGVAVDLSGNVYATNANDNTVVKIDAAGVAVTVATLTVQPMGVAVDDDGAVYVTVMHAIAKISKTDGSVKALAGSKAAGFVDGVGTSARFNNPKAITIGSDGNLYIADYNNHCIRKLTLATNEVTTYAGVCTSPGDTDGEAASAKFIYPEAIAAAVSGDVLYVTDGVSNGRVRKIFVSMGNSGPTAAAPTPATTPPPRLVVSTHPIALPSLSGGSVAVASDGSIYLSGDHRILRLTEGSDVYVSVYSGSNASGLTNGDLASARYNGPRSMALGSSGDLYICDYFNRVVRKISGGSTVSTFSTKAFSTPMGLAIDSSGNVYIADTIAKTITTLSSSGAALALATLSTQPFGVAVAADGAVYFTDDHFVKMLSPDGSTVTVLAGSTVSGFADGTGTAVQFAQPRAIAMGSNGNLYIADFNNHCIRKLTLATNEVTTYAGVCTSEGSTDGAATAARFSYPSGIAATSSGVLYVTDGNPDARLRKIYIAP